MTTRSDWKRRTHSAYTRFTNLKMTPSHTFLYNYDQVSCIYLTIKIRSYVFMWQLRSSFLCIYLINIIRCYYLFDIFDSWFARLVRRISSCYCWSTMIFSWWIFSIKMKVRFMFVSHSQTTYLAVYYLYETYQHTYTHLRNIKHVIRFTLTTEYVGGTNSLS